MKNKIIRYIVFLVACVLMAGSCKHEPVYPVSPCRLPGTVSFKKDIQPIFNANCGNTDLSCHAYKNKMSGLYLDSVHAYTVLMKKGTGYVDTLNPPLSLVYAQMISTTDPMPPTGRLDSCTIKMVLKWIEQKAPNN